jgi:hypothetical protein
MRAVAKAAPPSRRRAWRLRRYLILQAEGTLDINTVFAGIVVLTVFALVLDGMVTFVEDRLLSWKPKAGETEKFSGPATPVVSRWPPCFARRYLVMAVANFLSNRNDKYMHLSGIGR